MAIGLAPDDPQTHFAAAVIYQKTFDEKDVRRSIAEYEEVAALSPNNYLCWLELGRVRERVGDTAGADLAFNRALLLAPNYAEVRWAFGNALLRAGRTVEAFEHIKMAADANPILGNPAVVTAMTAFDGDAEKVREAIGNSARTNAAIATYFAGQKRFPEADAAWQRIPPHERATGFKDAGTALVNIFLPAKQFRSASLVFGDVSGVRTQFETVSDGGFETAVKSKEASVFEWQIASGAEPQIALSTAQKHSGNNSLMIVFNTMQAADFRAVSQTVAVAPATNYEFELFYRSELKTSGTMRWEIADASDGKLLAKTEPIAANSDWMALKAQFSVPGTSDGIVIHLVRTDCPASICPINGRVWFDDVLIRRQ